MTVPAANLVSLAEAMISRARATSTSGGEHEETAAAIAALLITEPRSAEQVRTIVTVIVGDALADPFRETTANRWRPLLPERVRRPLIGATVNRLRAAGFLVATGRHVRSTDKAGRNVGKLQPIYVFDAEALHEHNNHASSGGFTV